MPAGLIVAGRDDLLARRFAEFASARGVPWRIVPMLEAAQLLTIERNGSGAEVSPDLPLLILSNPGPQNGTDPDALFHHDEAAAMIWAAASLMRSPVMPRPGLPGWTGRWSPEPAITRRRLGAEGKAQRTFAGASEAIGPDEAVIDLWTLQVGVHGYPPHSMGPYRARALTDDPSEIHLVIGASVLSCGGGGDPRLSSESARAAAALSLNFAACVWQRSPLGEMELASIDPYLRWDLVAPVWSEARDCLLTELTRS